MRLHYQSTILLEWLGKTPNATELDGITERRVSRPTAPCLIAVLPRETVCVLSPPLAGSAAARRIAGYATFWQNKKVSDDLSEPRTARCCGTARFRRKNYGFHPPPSFFRSFYRFSDRRRSPLRRYSLGGHSRAAHSLALACLSLYPRIGIRGSRVLLKKARRGRGTPARQINGRNGSIAVGNIARRSWRGGRNAQRVMGQLCQMMPFV